MPFDGLDPASRLLVFSDIVDSFLTSPAAATKSPPFPFRYFCDVGVWTRALRDAARAKPDETVAEVYRALQEKTP
jgi:hypothetical protein